MKTTLLTLVAIHLLASCGNDQNSLKKTITGNINNVSKNTIIYFDYITPTEVITKDSSTIDMNGNFSFHNTINETAFYRLRLDDQNMVTLVLEKNETPTINGDGNNLMETYSITGSKEANRLKIFNLNYKINATIQDSLGIVYEENRHDSSLLKKLQQSSLTAIKNMNLQFVQLINDQPASLVSLATVQQLDPKAHIELYKKVDKALFHTMPNSVYVKAFHQAVESMTTLFIGDEAPDITLNDINGNPISLSSLRGKIVLLDFWASWCRPCRAENPNVVRSYNKYNKQGFDIFSVSLDGMPQQNEAHQNWLDAIAKDGLVWKNHVSDLKGWESSVVPLFGIEGIPYTLLIDKEGIIIGKNLKGNDLENKLIALFE